MKRSGRFITHVTLILAIAMAESNVLSRLRPEGARSTRKPCWATPSAAAMPPPDPAIQAHRLGAIAMTTFIQGAAEFLTRASPDATQGLAALGALGLDPRHAAALLNRFIDQQAFTRAAEDMFLGSAVLFAALIAVVWCTRPSRSAAPVDAGGAH
ncbi:hypothetical protein [Ideonella sp. YS5]|uniref:hypothetical protein n=1 Tax=Ideonella sp. YS5 TaxID=3453714 RepID=UPI003EEA7871